jgi:type II secretory pathway component GspD/PulD (secretin)
MPRLFALGLVGLLGLSGIVAAGKDSDDTPAAAKTRKLLQTKITVNFKDTRLDEVLEEIKDEHVKGISFRIDSKGGVSRNSTLTYSGKDVTLADALDKMFSKNDLGYYVISKKGNAYDGTIWIKKGKDRGYPLKP